MKFSSEAFNKSDKLCRDISLEFLAKNKDEVSRIFKIKFTHAIENTNKYGVDIKLMNGDQVAGYLECEQSFTWPGGIYRYADTGLPKRKFKYMKYSIPVLLVKISGCADGLICYSAEDMNKSGYNKNIPNARSGNEVMRILDKKYLHYFPV